MARASFLVDGFNVYHSLDQLQRASGASVKWLDLRKLCKAYLHPSGSISAIVSILRKFITFRPARSFCFIESRIRLRGTISTWAR